MSEENKISINGKVDRSIYGEFIKESQYYGFSRWKALEKAMEMFTKKLKSDGKK